MSVRFLSLVLSFSNPDSFTAPLLAVTISLRYLNMRRQFADPDLKPGDEGFGQEKQVISYPGVYRRVLPVLARTIVFMTAGKDMVRIHITFF